MLLLQSYLDLDLDIKDNNSVFKNGRIGVDCNKQSFLFDGDDLPPL